MKILRKQKLKEDILIKRDIFALLIILTCSISSFAKYSGGTGEPNTPYQIANVADLLTLANDINDYNKCFIMTADIDLDPNISGNQVFTRAVIAWDISNSNVIFDGNAFKGIFDGASHKITKLTIDTNGLGNDFLGLFGSIASGGKVRNLGMEDISITGGGFSVYLGGLAGQILSGVDINSCYSTGAITGGEFSGYLGGLVGYNNYGIISYCYSTVNISGMYKSICLGGLVGYNNDGTISSCYSTGNVTGGDYSADIGGLMGYNDSYYNIVDCYSTGNVTGGNSSRGIGGLAGLNSYGEIDDCYSTGYVSGGDKSICLGGLAGYNHDSIIMGCYSTGDVCGLDDSNCIGGLVGYNRFDQSDCGVINCYSTGSVAGSDQIGGLVGRTYESYIYYCYSAGVVTGDSNVGGFVGYSDNHYPMYIKGSYYLDVAGPNNGIGLPRTDTQMKQQGTFGYFDFGDVWAICETTNYPRLIWQISAADFVCPDGVNFFDYSFFAERWLNTDCVANNDCDGTDFDTSDTVDIADLKVFCSYWLQGL